MISQHIVFRNITLIRTRLVGGVARFRMHATPYGQTQAFRLSEMNVTQPYPAAMSIPRPCDAQPKRSIKRFRGQKSCSYESIAITFLSALDT